MREASGARSGSFGVPWSYTADADRLNQSTILVVEDDRDIRDMLATLLDLAGFGVVGCDTAEAALSALRERQFDLVLTDYALPSRTGLWMLRQAEAEGLISGTPVVIVTAHPNVEEAAPYEVIQKPFDLDDLVERVRQRTESGGGRPRRQSPPSQPGDGRGEGGNDGDCPEPVELILYVSAQSPRSVSALRNIKSALSRFSSSKVKLTVCDLSVDPLAGAEDSIAFTPTLVRRAPAPRTFILGHVSNPDLLLELLGDCDLDGH
jgi:CheY-like chemotaxis protein